MGARFFCCLVAALVLIGAGAVRSEPHTETMQETICRLIESSAQEKAIPPDLFTRLIWRESSFQPGAVSSAGAQGIAQFMPGTAAEQGLDDPFDPEKAIPASAAYLNMLKQQFGNWGLALAAYNAGPTRVANWQARGGYLPAETEDYVAFITGHSVYDWAGDEGAKLQDAPRPPVSCLRIVATIEITRPRLIEGPYAPYGVQLSGNFSKTRAIASYQRAANRFPALLGGRPTLILGSRVAGRGRRAFYRVRLPEKTIKDARALCSKLLAAGGACVVLRN